jgi:membrane associated rhomboid family serine protease
MRSFETTPLSTAFPRPSKPLSIVLGVLFGVWVLYAAGLNWMGLPASAFLILTGNTSAIADGQVWRLFTAPFLHDPMGSPGVQHIMTALMGIYFLGSALERAWGPTRFIRFLLVSAYFAFAVQWLIALVLPADFSNRLVPDAWYGSTPMLEALAIAFALSLRNQRILLFFVLPMGSRGLIIATVVLSLLLLVANALGPSGHIAPFAGMAAGWLFGGGTPSPARKLWLKWRLQQLDRESRGGRSSNGKCLHLEVLPGGRSAAADRGRAERDKKGPPKKGRPLH